MKPETQFFLKQLSRSIEAKRAAIADNCRFDERIAPSRWSNFESRLLDPLNVNWEDWSETERLNYQHSVTVISSSIPDSFLELNQSAWLQGIVTNRTVVRLEHLGRLFGKKNLSFEQLQGLLGSKDADQQQLLESLVQYWNGDRDGRPMFAAFYDEIQAEADHDDWQHQLRDRLGLGHYGSDKGVAIPVALMRYSLDEVVAVRKAPNAFALPTVLDGGMHEFFFPVPKSHPYGATLHLAPDQADLLTAEILHCRIDYQVKHLWKIGLISRPHQIENDNLRSARDLHLLALREATDRADFGEPMEGRK